MVQRYRSKRTDASTPSPTFDYPLYFMTLFMIGFIGVVFCGAYLFIASFASQPLHQSYVCPDPTTETLNNQECTKIVNGNSTVVSAINITPTPEYFLVMAVPTIVIIGITCFVCIGFMIYTTVKGKSIPTVINHHHQSNVEMNNINVINEEKEEDDVIV